FGASVCRIGMRNTALPCSVGIVDVRITNAWIYPEAEKKRWQKASAMRNEMALAVGSRRWLLFCLVCWLSYRRLKLLLFIREQTTFNFFHKHSRRTVIYP